MAACSSAEGEATVIVNRLSTESEFGLNHYEPLYLAAMRGDWKAASEFFEGHPGALTASISVTSMTALHVAVFHEQAEFTEKLLELMPSDELEMRDTARRTPLHFACMCGSIRIARALVGKNPALLQTEDGEGYTPLHTAAFAATGHKELVWYLAKATKNEPPSYPFTGEWAGDLICSLTSLGFHDISLQLLETYPSMTTAKSKKGDTLLGVLATGRSNFPSRRRFSLQESFIYQNVPADKEAPQLSGINVAQAVQWLKRWLWKVIEKLVPVIGNRKLRHENALKLVHVFCRQLKLLSTPDVILYFLEHEILTDATRNGVVEIVSVCLQYFPDLLWVSFNKQTLMHIAVASRQEKIFTLLCARNAVINQQAFLSEDTSKNILTMAAELPSYAQLSSVSCAALQMQKEMQWFKAAESITHPSVRELRFGGRTAWHIFKDNHKELRKDGEKWMKYTSNSCMIVSTLIATVIFAAAFTVPGGNDNATGLPVLLQKESIMGFAVSDAIALSCSIISILVFLSILTSPYAEEDFLIALPMRLIIGLILLFIAIVAMLATFYTTLSIVLNDRWRLFAVPIMALTSIPVAYFEVCMFPLIFQIVQSTYWAGHFVQKRSGNLVVP